MLTASINLLPSEIILQRKQSDKVSLVSKLSIGGMILLVFLTSATLALRVSQNMAVKQANANLAYAEGKVSSLKGKEGQVVLLKQRLEDIQSFAGGDAKKKAIFNLLISLTPSGIQISELSLDNKGVVIVNLESDSLNSINNFLTDLVSPEKNLDLISKIDLDNLALGKNRRYFLSLKITAK